MKLKATEDLNALGYLSGALRLFQFLRTEYGYSRTEAYIILTLANCAASPSLPDQLNAPELLFYSGYPGTRMSDIQQALKALSHDESAPLQRHKQGRNPALYSLSGNGVQIARKCLEVIKTHREELNLLSTASEYELEK